MKRFWRSHHHLHLVAVVVAVVLATWQVSAVLAQAPQPNPVASGINVFATGPAASIHGDPGRGRILFATNCAACHNDRGIGGIANPGSNDGTIPAVNPIDPGFLEQSQGDPAQLVQAIDPFVQHGSRPAGPNPQQSMIAWGDQKLLSQNDIADVEAYVMSLNGVYWPDRWSPPAEVRVVASLDQDRDEITYEITLVNHGAAILGNLDLVDNLPPGLDYQTSYFPTPGNNGGKVTGTAVEWNNLAGVPQGGTLGPFIIIANRVGKTIPPNVVQLGFTWQAWDGTRYHSTAISSPAVPIPPKKTSAPVAAPTTSVGSATPSPSVVASPSAAAGSATPQPSGTPVPASPTSAAVTSPAPPSPTSANAAPTSTPASVATPTPTPVEETESTAVAATETASVPTATAVPATAVPTTRAPQNYGVQIVQPLDVATSWGYNPSSITIQVGDTVTWTNVAAFQHTVTADDGSFDSGLINTGATWSYTFTTAGTYTYHCAPHPWMKGTVIVQGS